MIPDFDITGNLPPGVHWASWAQFAAVFAFTAHREILIQGLKRALKNLHTAGCSLAYIDGSFVTSKSYPRDFDVCWDTEGVDPSKLNPIFLDFENGRRRQKAEFGGELFPSKISESKSGQLFIDFFQVDKNSGKPKGIVAINLKTLEDD